MSGCLQCFKSDISDNMLLHLCVYLHVCPPNIIIHASVSEIK